MEENRLKQLSDRQRQLLDLVASGTTTSKALAQKTGLATGTIDNALQQAAKTLGVNGRELAAQRFKELEENSHEASHVRKLPLPNPANSGPSVQASTVRRAWKGLTGFLRGPPLGGEEFTLRWDQILLQILRVAAVGIAGVSALVAIVFGLFRTFG